MKKIVRLLLLALVFIGIGYWTLEKFSGLENSESPAVSSTVGQSEDHEVVVIYFSDDTRCEGCEAIEALTEKTLKERFPVELSSGVLRFEIHNIDQSENEHFTRDYELAFKTVVISDRSEGEERSWQKMDKVWSLFVKPDEFMNYLAKEIRFCLDKPA